MIRTTRCLRLWINRYEFYIGYCICYIRQFFCVCPAFAMEALVAEVKAHTFTVTVETAPLPSLIVCRVCRLPNPTIRIRLPNATRFVCHHELPKLFEATGNEDFRDVDTNKSIYEQREFMIGNTQIKTIRIGRITHWYNIAPGNVSCTLVNVNL